MTHEERCVVDPATLPPDAVRHGTIDSIVQRLHIDVELERIPYDAYFIFCALQHKNALLTLDGGLRQAAMQAGVTILEVTP